MTTEIMLSLLFQGLLETFYMVLVSLLCASFFGIPLGMSLFMMRPQGVLEHRFCYRFLSITTNALRSIPFIILLVAIVPLTRLIVGTSIGTNAAMVPLVLSAIPFIGRIVENALAEVPSGLIEAAQSMGASPSQIAWKFLWPEALPSIVKGLTVTSITLVGYSAMAGAVGGGGLGDLGIRYGYQRFDGTMMIATIGILMVLVQGLQWIGDFISNKLNRK